MKGHWGLASVGATALDGRKFGPPHWRAVGLRVLLVFISGLLVGLLASCSSVPATPPATYTLTSGPPLVFPDEDGETTAYGLWGLSEGTLTVDGVDVTLTVTKACITWPVNACRDGELVTWTGTLKGDQAVVQVAGHPIAWEIVTFGTTPTIDRPEPADNHCHLADGTKAGLITFVGDIHFTCE